MDINFEYYKIFYYVAKYKSITKAAAALGSSQPNVTRVMKLLESQLNCRLFIREPRGVTLTEEGERLYSHTEVAYTHLIRAQEEISGQDSIGFGTVEIGATETALHTFLLTAMRDFKMKYPKIRIKVHNSSTPEIMKYLVAGKLDFAMITAPFEIPKTFQCENVWYFHEILVGGTQYRHLCSEKISLDELMKYPWIGLGKGTATYELYKNFFIKHHVDMELDMEVATSDLLLPLIRNNLGIGFVPESLALPLLQKKLLVQIHTECEIPPRSIGLISDKGRGKSMAADTFYKYLKDHKNNSQGKSNVFN